MTTNRRAHRLGLAAACLVVMSIWVTLPVAAQTRDCSKTSVGLTALNDLGAGLYEGAQGGLYPGGSNEIPEAHAALGLKLAELIEPLDPSGSPSPGGAVVMISVGVSSTRVDFDAFIDRVAMDPSVNDSLVLVNGAQDQRPITSWVNPDDSPWRELERRLARAGVTSDQVQVAWVQLPERAPNGVFPAWAESYGAMLEAVVQNLATHYPNLRIAYLSSRPYGGYASQTNPEPYSYEQGFGVKWTIERQIVNGLSSGLNADPQQGLVTAPWLAWGPYLWTDGLGSDGVEGGVPGRSDGLEWTCEDVNQRDGIHPTESGANKTGELLIEHLHASPTAQIWFLDSPRVNSTTTTVASPAAPSTTETHASLPGLQYGPSTTAVPDRIGRTSRGQTGAGSRIAQIGAAALLGGLGVGSLVRLRNRRREDQ